jgi:hypothetical protein
MPSSSISFCTIKTAKEPAFTHYGVSKLNFDFTLDITRAQDELGYGVADAQTEAIAEALLEKYGQG